MNKSQRIKRAVRRTRWENFKYTLKRIITWPWRVCCAIWKWLKSIDIVGMINLTLLVIIILLFVSLIVDVVRCRRCPMVNNDRNSNVTVVQNDYAKNKDGKIVRHTFNTVLPLKADKKTGITPKIRTVGVDRPQIVRETSLPVNSLTQQNLSGDTVVDVNPQSPILSNGTKINGNLIIQNMRKYTLPCGMKINGHLFVRNVQRLHFCGEFTVNGNIYVNRESSFGALPKGTKINGQIIF